MKKHIPTIAIAIVLIVLISMFIYRHYMEFNNTEVKKLLAEEASKFGTEQENVYQVLLDNAMDIMNRRNMVSIIRDQAKVTGLPKEKILVDMTIAQAQSLKYIN